MNKFIIIGIVILIGLLSGCINEPDVSDAEIKSYTGIVFEVHLQQGKTVCVFDDGFYLSFVEPNYNLVDEYPVLDSYVNAYASLIVKKGQEVTVDYVHWYGSNYFDKC